MALQSIAVTVDYMSERETGPPARAWYDLVIERIAIKGWSVSELAQRAGVGRPTIYGWRDNLRRPQARPVNAVADALGIAREQALRLAGVIGTPEASPAAPEIPPELEAYRPLVEDIRKRYPRPEDHVPMLEAIAATLRGEPPPTGRDAEGPSAGRKRAG